VIIDPKTLLEFLLRRGSAEKARIFAYAIAPAVVLSVAAPGIWSGTFVIDATRPLSVSELKTVTFESGEPIHKPGVVIIVEPSAPEYHIPLGFPPQQMWSSLDDGATRANRARSTIDAAGVHGKPPFLGVNAPVTFVLEGLPGKEIYIPGGTEKFEDFVIQSKRPVALLSGVLLACMFAFGMSSVTAFPSVNSNKRGSS
jgi:hypothetical protein